MNSLEDLKNHLVSFNRYYTFKKENVLAPFSFQAEFHSHTEQYFLVKSAHLSDIDSNEYVYFGAFENLNFKKAFEVSQIAWNDVLSKIAPQSGHRNSDVIVVLFADCVDSALLKSVKKIKNYKSYKHSFWGWSHLKIVVKDVSTGAVVSNFQGSYLKKIFK